MKAYMILKNITKYGGKPIDRKGLLFSVDIDIEKGTIKINDLIVRDYSVDSGIVVIDDEFIKNITDNMRMRRTINFGGMYTEEEIFSEALSTLLGDIWFFKAPDDDAAKLLFEVNY